jgi:hypothetical protein
MAEVSLTLIDPEKYEGADKNDPTELVLQDDMPAEDWDEATPLHLHVNMPPAAKRTTPAPAASKLQVVVQVFQRFPPWGAVLVAVVLIVAWAYLATHGKAPIP